MRHNLVLSGSKLQSTTLSNVQVVEFVEKNETVDVVPLITYAPSASPTTTPHEPFSLFGMESSELMSVFIPIFALRVTAINRLLQVSSPLRCMGRPKR